jgi:1-deoxy-D-xylulose-5-phosphate reductoisomerase
MVEFFDGAVMAQMSYPSMELPIQLALTYPDRFDAGLKSLDFATLKSLTFEQVDSQRFPCFDLVVDAGKYGQGFPAVANGANEVAVKLFLDGIIGYNDIYKAIYGAMQAFYGEHHIDVEALIEADAFARRYVKELFGV